MRLTSIDWRALTDVATLKQRLAQTPTWAWFAVALVPPAIAGGLLVAARQAERLALAQEHAGRATLADLRAKAAAAPPADQTPFAARLPLTQPSSRAVTHLREAAEAQSVLVTAISTAHQPPTANTLGRMSLDVNLRGSYAAIKTVLAEVLTRDAQQAVLQQLSLRRAAGAAPAGISPMGGMGGMNRPAPMGAGIGAPSGGDLEARVVATWLSRPLAESGSTSTLPPAPRAKAASGASEPASAASAPSIASPASAASASAAAASAAIKSAEPAKAGEAIKPPAPAKPAAPAASSPSPRASSASAPAARR